MQEIIIRGAHDKKLSGYKTSVGHDIKNLIIPDVCGCTSTFAPAGRTETGDDGVVREVWKQVGFKFNEYCPPL